jgi:DNA-binding CsgD family transcriptional regulator/tetratricopeptide (TPR) repeat protein
MDTAQGRLFELLLGMLRRLAAKEPVLLVVEDIHWADRSTVDVLAFLTRNLRDEPILLVATYRTDEPQSRGQLLPFIAELGRRSGARRVDLARLNRAEVAEQVSSIMGKPAAPALVDGIFARSQGNAFFSEELLAAGAITGGMPQTLQDVVTARIGALTDPARELVRVASAAGRRFPESLLAHIAESDDRTLGVALRELLDQQILVRHIGPQGERLGFRHALVREVLYADLLASERTRLHAACARAIEESLKVAPDPVLASELAHHWQAADEPRRALKASITAALAAERAGASSEAALQFERALGLLDKLPDAEGDLALDRLQLLEHAAANQLDNPGRAVEHIRDALRRTDPELAPTRAGTLYAALGRYLWWSGDGAGALVACREAVRLVPAAPPSVDRARVLAGLGQILMILAHSDEAVDYADQAVTLAAAVGAGAIESHALNTLGLLTAYRGSVDEGLAMLRRSLEIATEVGSVEDIHRAYTNLQDVLIVAAARFDEAAEVGIQVAGPPEAPATAGLWTALALIDTAWALYLAGRWDEAMATMDRVRLQPTGGVGEIERGIRAAQLMVGRGDFDGARRELDTVDAHLQPSVDTQWIAPAAAARAELALWMRDPKGALQAVAGGLSRVEPSFGANVSRIGPILALGVRAAADAAQLGPRRGSADTDAARAEGLGHLAAMQEIHDEIRARWPAHGRLAQPYLALCKAEAARLEGRRDPRGWAAAATLFEEEVRQPYVAAYARFREAEALLSARRETGVARASLRKAHETARSLRAEPLDAAVRELARRAGMDLGRDAGGQAAAARPGGLTAREQEILALVATGLTNRQIGDHLFITEKTASHHVSNVLAKLGVRGRVEAAAEAARLGITLPPE